MKYFESGEPFVIIKIDHYVTTHVFAKALTCCYFRKSISFPESLTKKEGKEILGDELFFHGIRGEIDTSLYEGAAALSDEYEAIYMDACAWVRKNYPGLIKGK